MSAYIPARSGRLRHGFTLIEMLIVLAVIGLLAALLFPVFQSVRQAAHVTACASNLRQINLAINLYAADNNDFYPRAGIPGVECTWLDRIAPYVKAEGVFDCPSFEKSGVPRDTRSCPPRAKDAEPINTEDSYFGSYDMNSLPRRFRARRFSHPTSTILLLDGDGGFVSPGTDYEDGTGPTLTTKAVLRNGVNIRHNDGSNVLWADGHVKWLSLQKMTERRLWLVSGE